MGGRYSLLHGLKKVDLFVSINLTRILTPSDTAGNIFNAAIDIFGPTGVLGT